jgi:hypothetical protein
LTKFITQPANERECFPAFTQARCAVPTAAAKEGHNQIAADGTWNTLNNNTNVWRLKSLTAESAEQHV